MRPTGTAQELERRRKQAVNAVAGGMLHKDVAQAYGVDPDSVGRWVRASRKRRKNPLAAKPHPGRTRRLTRKQERQLVRMLTKGALKHGHDDNLWNAFRVQALIKSEFEISYHVEHVRHILTRRMGWTSQMPETRARNRDEKQIKAWVDKDLPRIKKKSAD